MHERTGFSAVLLQGPEWKMAHPCGFYSCQYIPAERNCSSNEGRNWSNGNDMLLTIPDHLSGYSRLMACSKRTLLRVFLPQD